MGDPGYERFDPASGAAMFPSFLQGFNRRWFARNADGVYLCSTAGGVAAALDDAISRGGEVKVRGGGHCYENFVFNDCTSHLIDLSPMADVGHDEKRGFFLEAGGTNWSVFGPLLWRYGRTLPAGSCYSVGLGGHICGGGYGGLCRLHGLTVDWLTGVEMVVKDHIDEPARVVYVDRHSRDQRDRDLLWASQGGGGGNFGIITRYYFEDLPEAPSTGLLATVSIDWADLDVVKLQHVVDVIADFSVLDDEMARRTFVVGKLHHSANGQIAVVIQVALPAGESPDAGIRRGIQPIITNLENRGLRLTDTTSPIVGHPGWAPSALPPREEGVSYTLQQLTFYELVQTMNSSGSNQRGKYKSAYMNKPFPPEQVAAIYSWLTTIPDGLTAADMKQSLLQVDSYGGKINEVEPHHTAIAQRSSIMKLQYQTYWTDPTAIGRGDPDRDDAFLGWMRDFYSTVYASTGGIPDPADDPDGVVDGCYFNYPDVDLNEHGLDTALRLYFLGNLPRLQHVKAEWDPGNVFHNAQSIPLPPPR